MLFCFGLSGVAQNKYKLKIQVDGFTDSTAYLAYYYGKGQYYRDTAAFDKKGEILFDGAGVDTLAHGMYSLVVSNSKVFDFIVDGQEFSLKTTKDDVAKNMKATNSEENDYFFEYLSFLADKQKEGKRLQELRKSEIETDKEKAQKELEELDDEVRSYIADFHKRHKGSFTSNFIHAITLPVVPESPKKEDGSIDSTFSFKYYKAHYFDNYDFTDERLLRTSTFHEKIYYYIEKLTYQDPDSLIKSVDYILSRAALDPILFRYALTTFTSKFERSEAMGMDAVFVHLIKEYFMKGQAKEWFTDDQLKQLSERAESLDPLLIGKKAPNIVVRDTAQKEFLQLYDIESEYTVVYIWSPECGHCKVATPKLKELYDKYKSKGVEVFGVGNEFENEEWIKFINKHDLNWINGSDGIGFKSNFRHDYDVYSTPQTYLLDKDKKILAKKMSVESLERILEFFMNKSQQSNNEK